MNHNTSKRYGFSLIELLVVVAIVGVLAAFAIPSYRAFATRTAVVSAQGQVFFALKQLATTYEQTGAFPAVFNFLGVASANTPGGGTANFTSPWPNSDEIYIITYSSGKTWTNSATSTTVAGGWVWLQFFFPTSYLDTTNPGTQSFPGYYALRAAKYYDASGAAHTICGTWASGGDINDIPPRYLPSSCTCTNMASASSGTFNPPAGC